MYHLIGAMSTADIVKSYLSQRTVYVDIGR